MNESVPTGTEIVRPFLPARDFDLSKRFYEALGFEMMLDSDEVAIFRLGASSFILQKYFQRDWAENFMMKFEVDDARAWYEHVKPIIDSKRYKNARVGAPEMIGDTTIIHVHDPCGVLLIFIQ